MAGNEDAPLSDLQVARRWVEKRLTARPHETRLLANQAEILAVQGGRTAAAPLVRDVRQRIGAGDKSVGCEQLAWLLILINQPEAALTAVEPHFGSETRHDLSRTFLR